MDVPWFDTLDGPTIEGWLSVLTDAFPNTTGVPVAGPDGRIASIRVRVFTPEDDRIAPHEDYLHLLRGYLAVLYLGSQLDPNGERFRFHHLEIPTVIRACAQELLDGVAWK